MKNYLLRLDRSILTVGTLDQDPLEETRFWLSKPPIERLMALKPMPPLFTLKSQLLQKR